MTTVSDNISAAFVAAEQSVPGVARVELEPAGDPDIFPAIQIFEGMWRVLEREAGLIRWEKVMSIDGFTLSGDGAAASAERNALHAAAVEAIMLDDTLGGLVENVEPGDLRKWTPFLADQIRLGFSQDFHVQFTTSRTNPGLPG